jgi:hypothetical protein
MEKRHHIRVRAHEIWIERGRPEGRDVEFWLASEQELEVSRTSVTGEVHEALHLHSANPTAGARAPTLLRDDVSKEEPNEHADPRASRDDW